MKNNKQPEKVAVAVDKDKALATALAQIEKQFGKGAIMRLGQNEAMQVEAISTGSFSLDMALGIDGLPRGRIVEIYGPESSGKTTLALHCIAEGQKGGGNVAFIDVEHALDPVYAGTWAWMSTPCWCPSPIPGSRHWRLPRRWCVRERST